MKLLKKALSVAMASAVLLGISASVSADSLLKISSIFPDKQFAKIVKTYDLNSDGYLNSTEISKIKSINLDNVEYIDGLEYLTSCKTLYVMRDCTMGVLDLGRYKNIETCYILETAALKTFIGGAGLKNLYINGSGLTSIALNRSVYLRDFSFRYNKTYSGSLDLMRNTSLKIVDIDNVNINEIYFASRAKLEKLFINSTRIRSIDLSGCTNYDVTVNILITNCRLSSIKLPGNIFMLTCLTNEYSGNGRYYCFR